MKNIDEIYEWALNLQNDYDEIGKGDVTFYSFADSAKDFLDYLIDRIDEN